MSKPLPNIQSPAARRLAEAEVRRLIAKFAPEYERLIRALRRSLRKRLPTAYEVVYEYNGFFLISHSPSEHGYEGVFALRASADGVRLYCNRGKGLPDPEKLLQGSGGQARWILVEASSTMARPAVVRLVEAAIARNPVPFARTGRGVVIIRSGAAKRRQRSAGKPAAPAKRSPRRSA